MSCSTCGGKGQTKVNGMTITCPGCRGFGHEIPKPKPKVGDVQPYKPSSKEIPSLKEISQKRFVIGKGETVQVKTLPFTKELVGHRHFIPDSGGLTKEQKAVLVGQMSVGDYRKHQDMERKRLKRDLFGVLYGSCGTGAAEGKVRKDWRPAKDSEAAEPLKLECLKARDSDEPLPKFKWNFDLDYDRLEREILEKTVAFQEVVLNNLGAGPEDLERLLADKFEALEPSLTPKTVSLKASPGDSFWTVRCRNFSFEVVNLVLTYVRVTRHNIYYDTLPSEFVFATKEAAQEVCDRMCQFQSEDLERHVRDLESWVQILGLKESDHE